jgi:hypothetical protein
MFAANGMVYRAVNYGIAAPTPISFLERSGPNLKLEDLQTIMGVTGGMAASGVYCGDSLNQYVYTEATDLADPTKGYQLVQILPL